MWSTITTKKVHLTLLVSITMLIYANSIFVPYLYDDLFTIVNNPVIDDVSILADNGRIDTLPLLPDFKNSIKTRTFSYLTFAINKRLNGLNPAGYHVVNIAIHAANACLVYLLVTGLMTCSRRRNPDSASGFFTIKDHWPALFAALLFAAHPVQTNAVTYITQRFTSLVTLLYLLALTTYLAGRCAETKKTAILYFVTSFTVTVLSMCTKETAFTLPVIISVIELMFLGGRVSKRLLAQAPFYLTMLIIPLKLWALVPDGISLANKVSESTNLMNFENLSRTSYLFTQFRVIITYFRILVFPINLNFDHDYPVFESFTDPRVSCRLPLSPVSCWWGCIMRFERGIPLILPARVSG